MRLGPILIPQVLESRFGDKPVKLQAVCPQNGTAVPKGITSNFFLMILCHSFFVWFDLHLIGRNMNHQAGILTFDSNKKNETNSTINRHLLGPFLLFVLFNWGSLSNSTWHVPETEASHTNLSRVVDCSTGEIHHSRETGPPEQSQHEVQRPPAQSKPSAAPQKMTRPSQTQFFIPPRLANHMSTN